MALVWIIAFVGPHAESALLFRQAGVGNARGGHPVPVPSVEGRGPACGGSAGRPAWCLTSAGPRRGLVRFWPVDGPANLA